MVQFLRGQSTAPRVENVISIATYGSPNVLLGTTSQSSKPVMFTSGFGQLTTNGSNVVAGTPAAGECWTAVTNGEYLPFSALVFYLTPHTPAWFTYSMLVVCLRDGSYHNWGVPNPNDWLAWWAIVADAGEEIDNVYLTAMNADDTRFTMSSIQIAPIFAETTTPVAMSMVIA